ncbi:MAG: phosphoenolpyruvate--protein phosphotransferase [bacterium]
MKSKKILKGETISEGVGYGKACLYTEDLINAAPRRTIDKNDVNSEKRRLIDSIEHVKHNLDKTYNKIANSLGMAEAQVFNAHIMILEDSSYISQMEHYIVEELLNAEAAVVKNTFAYERKFKMFANEYFAERIEDIKDIARRLLRELGVRHTGSLCSFPAGEEAIIVAPDLSPSLVVGLDNKRVVGIVTEKGSKVSHGAVLAKALGIPVIIRVKGLIDKVKCCSPVLVDAYKGDIFPDPDEETISLYGNILQTKISADKKYSLGYATTRDNVKIYLYANAGSIHDIESAQDYGIAHIGLFRTEFTFLRREDEPSIDEQVAFYKKIIERTDGIITFRLLDIGGDKLLAYLILPKQDNPKLGLRGARIYSKYPHIIANQIKALLIAKGEHPLRILIPMISTLEEFRATRNNILQTAKILKRDQYHITIDNLMIGCMVEIPAVVHMIRDFADEADFLSIGTNDLIQYIMGVDRSNIYLDELYEPYQPAILRVLKDIIDETRDTGKEISVCGEIAGDPEVAKILVGFGFRYLSMNPHMINKVGDALSEYTLGELERAADDIFKATTLASVRTLLAHKKSLPHSL